MFKVANCDFTKQKNGGYYGRKDENEDKRGTNIKKLPHAFTEQGIYMLATVLRGELAEHQSIFIMRAFREIRHYIRQNQQFATESEMRLVNAKVSEISVQVAGLTDWKKKTGHGRKTQLSLHRHALKVVLFDLSNFYQIFSD